MGWFKRRKPKLAPTHLVVGLGNPGPQYSGTRHNVGFEVINLLADKNKVPIKKSMHQAIYGVWERDGKSILLVKPLTYMNKSGQSVVSLAKQFNLDPQNILVIADDLDLVVGKVRMRAKGSAGGHNGHKSIISSMGTQDYPRIKIGIGKSGDVISHVLNEFSDDERDLIDEAIKKSAEGVLMWLDVGIDQAMNETNRQDSD